MGNNNDLSKLTALATTIQKWAELCARQGEREPTPELQWYLKGRSEAHAMDAERARALGNPTCDKRPPKGDPFTAAYKATLALIGGLTKEEKDYE